MEYLFSVSSYSFERVRRFTISIFKHKLIPLEKVSLYIHIPYCHKKCSYCDFYSTITGNETEINNVLTQILKDTEVFLEELEYPFIKTLFIGGGTPSSIPVVIFTGFLQKLGAVLKNIPQEYTIEINPETVSRELLDILTVNKINRISIGVQSLNERILATLGRNTNVENTIKALETIKKYWKGTFSIDLINAVPGQAIEMALSDIEKINIFSPDHISLYSLTFEPDTQLYNLLKNGKITVLSENIDTLMQKKSISLLKTLGYKRYEISNYCKKGKESLHNLNYWKMGTSLGIGPSAASTLLSKNGPVRLKNIPDTSAFISYVPINKRMEQDFISKESFLLEHLMMGFRLLKGIDILHINSVFKIDIVEYLKPLFIK